MINQSTVDTLRKLHCSAMADELTRQLEDAATYNTLGFENIRIPSDDIGNVCRIRKKG